MQTRKTEFIFNIRNIRKSKGDLDAEKYICQIEKAEIYSNLISLQTNFDQLKDNNTFLEKRVADLENFTSDAPIKL